MKSRRALLWLMLATGGLMVAAAAWWLLLSERSKPEDAGVRAGAALAAGLRAATVMAQSMTEPYRCARLYTLRAAADPIRVGSRALRLDGRTLRAEPSLDQVLVLGVIADSHGSSGVLRAVARSFGEADVELVVTLGGMGRTRAELTAALEALSQEGAWPILAMPGDWESIAEHRAAVAALAERGVFDGSQVRFMEMDGAVLATLPGAPHRSRLLAGDEGCLHTADDAAHIATALADRSGVRVLLSHVPPSQQGGATSDMGAAGIHVGERALARVLASTHVDMVIHGLVAPTRGVAGEHALPGKRPIIVAAGSADPVTGGAMHASPRALVVVLGMDRVSWRPVLAAPVPE